MHWIDPLGLQNVCTNVTGYHGTKMKNIEQMKKDGVMKPDSEGHIYLSKNQTDTFMHGGDKTVGGSVSAKLTIDTQKAKSVDHQASVPGNPETIKITTDVPLPVTVDRVNVRRKNDDGEWAYEIL